jgi:putative transposase
MANTYTQLHVQLVFAVKFRIAMIHRNWKENLHRYLTDICQSNKHKMLQINSVADHIHLFAGIRPHQSISDLAQILKSESTKWIKREKFCEGNFAWQEGYGAFSYSKSHVPDVIRYIQNQEAHHKKETFLDEYRRFLKVFEIEYDEKYIFKDPI